MYSRLFRIQAGVNPAIIVKGKNADQCPRWKFDMSRPAVSTHIKILATAGFIIIEAIGRERYCSLHPKGFKQVQAWLKYFDKFWLGKIQRMDELINRKP